MRLSIRDAAADDAPVLASLRNTVADDLTQKHGAGFWTGQVSDKGVLWGMRRGRVLCCLRGRKIVGTMSLGTIKPWAIDRSYFTRAKRPIYLTSMAIAPDLQRQGVGRFMMEAARTITVEWPGDAIWLDAFDAFDAAAGAGGFYAKCGFTEVGRATYRGSPLIYFEWRVG